MTAEYVEPAERISIPPRSPIAVSPVPAAVGPAVLFLLLATTVLAVGAEVFGVAWTAVLGGRQISAAGRACDLRAGVRDEEVTSVLEFQWAQAARARATACAVVTLHHYLWLSLFAGFTVLVALTGALCLLYPRWTIRRRRLDVLRREDDRQLWSYLGDLCTEVGLRKRPTFLIDPWADTVGGRTFGRPGCRYVSLDAGLVTRFATDRDRFRSAVLHELAHLRNRDVDPTYLTRTLWWAFALVCVAPTVVVLCLPSLTGWFVPPRPPRWSDVLAVAPAERIRIAAALLILTVLVYLTRSAVLRVRELHADARAVTYDGADRIIATITELAGPRSAGWRTWLTSHPTPRQRRDAIRAPAAGFRIRPWHLLVAGFAAAVTSITVLQVTLLAGGGPPTLTYAIAGLVGAVWLAVAITAGVWQAVAAATDDAARRLAVQRVPALVAVGFLVGDLTSFLTAIPGHPPLLVAAVTGSWPALLAIGLLVVGCQLLAAWCATVVRTAAASPGGRLSLPTTIAMATVVVGPPLAAWLETYAPGTLLTRVDFLDGLSAGPGPYLHLPLGGYAALAHGTELSYPPFTLLIEQNPLTVASLALLCLAPLLFSALGRTDRLRLVRPYPLRAPLLAAVVGGAAGGLLSAAAVVTARLTVPAAVRAGQAFAVAILTGVLPATQVAGIVVAAVVAVVIVPRHRPVLVPLAVFAAGVVTTVAAGVIVPPLSSVVNLFAVATPSRLAPLMPSATQLVTVLVYGTVLAIPAALTAAGVRAAVRGRAPRSRAGVASVPRQSRPRRRRGWVHPSALGVLVAVAVVATAGHASAVVARWSADTGRAPTVGGQTWASASGSTPDPCMVGTWVETSRRTYLTVAAYGIVAFDGSGILHTFSDTSVSSYFFATDDGKVHQRSVGLVRLDSSNRETVASFGHRVDITTSGSVTRQYRTVAAHVIYAHGTGQTRTALTVDGHRLPAGPLPPPLSSSDEYTCVGGDVIVLSGDFYVARLQRVGGRS